jgi:phage-related minor tail protein
VATLADLLIEIGVDSRGVAKGAGDIDKRLGKTWKKVGEGAALGGAAIGVALIAGIMSGLDSEVATDKLAAQLGATGEEAEKLGAQAGNLYKKGLGDSMETVSSALGAVKTSFGDLADDAVQPVTEKILNMAKAFEIDTSRAAQVAGQAVTSGLAKDATTALDLLTSSMQKVPSTNTAPS